MNSERAIPVRKIGEEGHVTWVGLNVSQAADLLGVSKQSTRRIMGRYGVKPNEYPFAYSMKFTLYDETDVLAATVIRIVNPPSRSGITQAEQSQFEEIRAFLAQEGAQQP